MVTLVLVLGGSSGRTLHLRADAFWRGRAIDGGLEKHAEAVGIVVLLELELLLELLMWLLILLLIFLGRRGPWWWKA